MGPRLSSVAGSVASMGSECGALGVSAMRTSAAERFFFDFLPIAALAFGGVRVAPIEHGT